MDLLEHHSNKMDHESQRHQERMANPRAAYLDHFLK